MRPIHVGKGRARRAGGRRQAGQAVPPAPQGRGGVQAGGPPEAPAPCPPAKAEKKMKRAYSPKEIAAKKWVTLPWGEKWSKPFGEPADNASWFISGASASGKSSFVMQLAKELCKYGLVLYLSYEEGVNQSFQRRMDYLGMNEVQGKFRVVTDDSYEELVERLRKPKSPKFVVVDSFQVAKDSAGFSYERAVELMKRFPKKCFIYISQEKKSAPMGADAVKLRYICDMKVRVMGYKAYCQGRAIGEAGTYYVVWKEGLIQTSNNL